ALEYDDHVVGRRRLAHRYGRVRDHRSDRDISVWDHFGDDLEWDLDRRGDNRQRPGHLLFCDRSNPGIDPGGHPVALGCGHDDPDHHTGLQPDDHRWDALRDQYRTQLVPH